MTALIIDTDIQDDVDDIGALAVAHGLVSTGEAELLGVVVNTTSRYGAGAVAAVNTWFGRPEIPIGVLHPLDDSIATDRSKNYAEPLSRDFPHPVTEAETLPDAVTLYRQLLAQAPDGSVSIVSIGFLTNLAALLASPADRVSALDGRALVAAKVARLVVMAGWFPLGNEFNILGDVEASRAVASTWPTDQLYLGFEAGESVMTGAELSATHPADSPVRVAYEIYCGPDQPRNSWDLATVLVAVRGGAELYTESEPGRVEVNADGQTSFSPDPQGTCRYLSLAVPPEQVAAVLDDLLRPQR